MNILKFILAILPSVLQGVVVVEQVIGAGKGQAKKQVIMDAVQAAAKVGEGVDEKHVQAVSAVIDGAVSSLNQSGVFSQAAAPAASVAQ